MTYRFKLQEPVAEGVRRIALEQIEMAEAKLAAKENTPALIHDARRCLKRLRALLRLIRPALDDDAYRREAERLSAIGKLLAQARDAHVMRQTLIKLQNRPQALPKGVVASLQRLLVADPAPGGRRQASDGRRQALVRLKQAKKLFTGKAVQGVQFEHLVEGLERAYDAARKRFRKAYRKSSDEAFHAWRKTVQLHWRHMLLLSRGWPEAFSARAGEAKELSRLLGEDHDYSMLLALVESRGAKVLAPNDCARLTTLCRSCQSELRVQARPRGARLFAETPDNLTERIMRYWSSAEHLAALAPPPDPAPAHAAHAAAQRSQAAQTTRQVLRKSLTSVRRRAR
jgi:CHAD domain-containing protein